MFTDIRCFFADIRCGHGYMVLSRLFGVFTIIIVITDIRYVHGYTLRSQVYGVFNDTRCRQG